MNRKQLTLGLLGALIAGASLMATPLTHTSSGIYGQAPVQPGTQTATPKREAQVERRERRQQKRIDQGVQNGSLTPKEAGNLERHEAKLNKDISKAEADGKITKKEQGQINREENRDSKRIYRKKHNARHQ